MQCKPLKKIQAKCMGNDVRVKIVTEMNGREIRANLGKINRKSEGKCCKCEYNK